MFFSVQISTNSSGNTSFLSNFLLSPLTPAWGSKVSWGGEVSPFWNDQFLLQTTFTNDVLRASRGLRGQKASKKNDDKFLRYNVRYVDFT